MGGLDNITKILSQYIDQQRLEHSIRVSECARELAKHYGADVEKAEMAGLIHDCAKCLPFDEMIRLSNNYGLELDNILLKNKALIHAPLGARMVKDLFGIDDKEIIDAIECHTTGKANMTMLEKVLCLADYIEPGRKYYGVDEIRTYAFKDINKALLKGLELSIKNVIDRGRLLHPKTVEARNYLLLEICDYELQGNKLSLKNL